VKGTPSRLGLLLDISPRNMERVLYFASYIITTVDEDGRAALREQMQAFILVSDTVLFNYRQQIGVMALKNRLPSTSSLKKFAEAGLLLSYGPDFEPLYGGAAVFIDKIFKGAKPADLPIEQPTKFELVVNLKAAFHARIENLDWMSAATKKEALRKLELLVVSDNVLSTDTVNAGAHVLLPAAAWGEKDGTVTNSERRISRQRPFLALPEEARPDWWMVAQVAQRMGFDGFAYRTAADVFRDGHDVLGARVRYRGPGQRRWSSAKTAPCTTYCQAGML